MAAKSHNAALTEIARQFWRDGLEAPEHGFEFEKGFSRHERRRISPVAPHRPIAGGGRSRHCETVAWQAWKKVLS